MGTELFHADRRTDGRTDGQTDMKKLIVDFRNYVTAPKKEGLCHPSLQSITYQSLVLT